jgi:[citrate (pro-3S)-lyase] ligase
MEVSYGAPCGGKRLQAVRRFLQSCHLRYDEAVSFSVLVSDDDGELCATGSLDGNVLKCIAVRDDMQGSGIAARVASELIAEAGRRGLYHLFVFTKPGNDELFAALGFYRIVGTRDAILMENKKDGIDQFVAGLKRATPSPPVVGAIVANCNPFTNGHLYLVETAAKECDALHIFILSEDKSFFSSELRRALAEKATAHIPKALVQPTGPYLVSAATFPDYFLPKDAHPEVVHSELDLTLFAERIAKPLNITMRFVGTEPYSEVTNCYNTEMHKILPRYGIAVRELERIKSSGDEAAISASRVRALLETGNIEAIAPLVPECVYAAICSMAHNKENPAKVGQG